MKDIALITNDTWRRDTLPNMDQLRSATESFSTLEAIAQGASTKSALPPIICSMYWKEKEGELSWDALSLPAFLSKHGYTTGAFIGTNPFASRWQDDFDMFWNSGRENFNKFTRKVSRGVDFALLQKETPGTEVLKQAKKWYNSTNGPRFMWIHLMDSHEPYYPGLRRGTSHGLLRSYKSLLENRSKFDEGEFFTESFSSETVEQLQTLYRACVQNVDEILPKFLEVIEDDATVLITGDHGEEFQHGHMKHQRLYDECIVVPFLTRWTLSEGFGFEDRLFHLDIAPIIAHGLGLSIPDNWRGQPTPPERPRISLMFNADHRIDRWFIGGRTNEYKYIQNYSYSTGDLLEEELYDLRQDPNETENIFTEDIPIVEEFRSKIDGYFDEVGLSRESLIGESRPETNRTTSEDVEERLEHLGYR
ncbi:sulfatase-like hydrolase/transferase [Natronomonas sp. F2-12]|uniref:Sulfatase-like hydrolase/transferase n=1 Tax=Natronomonas aquatica TaxID=2841590 RepID=A0A9R1CT03_9EURY|nr:sulfatase-like hydrolase/transferase [Natronomonas aquatica]MCQ4333144.1 sulfatase-like hydrolase/transferase [Natronomonas aquatica]